MTDHDMFRMPAARAAGMKCVIVPCVITRGAGVSGATLRLRELPELLSYLAGRQGSDQRDGATLAR